MFNINDIYRDPYTKLFTCTCLLNTELDAKCVAGKYIGLIRELCGFTTELTHSGRTVILTSPVQADLVTAANTLNKILYR